MQIISRDKWVKDSDRKECIRCSRKFRPLSRRRHHCRYCGEVICSDCSSITLDTTDPANTLRNIICVVCRKKSTLAMAKVLQMDTAKHRRASLPKMDTVEMRSETEGFEKEHLQYLLVLLMTHVVVGGFQIQWLPCVVILCSFAYLVNPELVVQFGGIVGCYCSLFYVFSGYVDVGHINIAASVLALAYLERYIASLNIVQESMVVEQRRRRSSAARPVVSKERTNQVISKVVVDAFKIAMENVDLGPEEEDWYLHGVQKDIEISMKKGGDGILVRGNMRVEIPFQVLSDTVTYRSKEYNDMLKSTRDVEKLDQNVLFKELQPLGVAGIEIYKCKHIKFRGIFPTKARDVCLAFCKMKLDNGKVVTLSCSVEHPEVPVQSDHVRMVLHCSMIVLDVCKDSSTFATMRNYSNVDLGGSIPSAISNQAAVNQALVLGKIANCAKKHVK